jgi:hypothetical protein
MLTTLTTIAVIYTVILIAHSWILKAIYQDAWNELKPYK